MSDRITLRMGDSTPDDLEIQRFFQLLDERGLSRQGWVKRALLVGFHSLEKALLDESLTESAKGSIRRKERKERVHVIERRELAASGPAAVSTADSRSRGAVVEQAQKQEEGLLAEAGPSASDQSSWYPVAPEPDVPVPDKGGAPPEQERQPDASAVQEPASTLPAQADVTTEVRSANPVSAETPLGVLLSGPDMQISEDTKNRVRRLTGGFGEGFDG